MRESAPVECLVVREALSARIDGEPGRAPTRLVAEHLSTCAECRSWYDSAVALTRRMRSEPAASPPDLTAGILAALDQEQAAEPPAER